VWFPQDVYNIISVRTLSSDSDTCWPPSVHRETVPDPALIGEPAASQNCINLD
jgi:hypothetical protein